LFKPGDVITTGSPSGGYGRLPKVFMKPGDAI
jgi:2-keto-4-pentenoate hydratase/2-oxohepta-3-ene-1,7-dioic acid hydratase in catechol pathway